jgi:sugar phosphate isomerase/epimerase
MLTRREMLHTTLASAAALPFAPTGAAWAGGGPEVARIKGVRMAVQSASFTFSGFSLPDIFKTMQGLGLKEIDIMSEHIEQFLGAPGIQLPGAGRQGPWTRPDGAPPAAPSPAAAPAASAQGTPGAPGSAPRPAFRGMDPEVREALRTWRLEVDLATFTDVKAQFDRAGLILFAYNLSFNDSYSDPEIERGLLMAKALGTRIITVSSPISVMPRVAPLAAKHDVLVAVHNHTEGPEHFEQAMALGRNIRVNLDVGHFFAMGHDPVAYLRAHHARVTNIHVKDRKSNKGREMAFGQGETPLREVLTLVRDQKYDIPVCIEYVGPDGPAVELKRCLDYCRNLLEA